jgi:hypothetical protein
MDKARAGRATAHKFEGEPHRSTGLDVEANGCPGRVTKPPRLSNNVRFLSPAGSE